ncbi:MAG: extracellular solute-binding protein [Pseudomonadota bacterium]
MPLSHRRSIGAVVAIASALLAACGGGTDESDTAAVAPAEPARPLVVYSSRAEQLIKPLFERYTAQTGVPVVYQTDSEQPLIQRLKAEGAATEADVLLTVDAGNLWYAAKEGVLQALDSPLLEASIPGYLRDDQGRWYGLSVRARTIVYDPTRVEAAELDDYAGLADERWRGRLCLRTSKKVYNQSLVAMLIARHGEERAEEIVRGWVANLATDVFSNDTRLMEAIVDGQCEVGVVNSYYYGRLQRDREQTLSLRLYFPPPDLGGVHVNVSGAGVVTHSDDAARAQALIEWLASPAAQGLFAGLNLEYPANPAVAPDPQVAAWGDIAPSEANLVDAGRLQAAAVRLMDRAGYR